MEYADFRSKKDLAVRSGVWRASARPTYGGFPGEDQLVRLRGFRRLLNIMWKKISAVLVGMLLVSSLVYAKGRQPCSGNKGGISHCSGGKFVCKDGTFSKSTKTCS